MEDVLNSKTFIKTLESFKETYPEILIDLVEDNYSAVEENQYLPSAWAFRFSAASPQKKKIMSFFDVNPTIKSEFAHLYIQNIVSKDDLPWIEQIKSFFRT